MRLTSQMLSQQKRNIRRRVSSCAGRIRCRQIPNGLQQLTMLRLPLPDSDTQRPLSSQQVRGAQQNRLLQLPVAQRRCFIRILSQRCLTRIVIDLETSVDVSHRRFEVDGLGLEDLATAIDSDGTGFPRIDDFLC